MDRSTLEMLEEALAASPENWKLRLQIAQGYHALTDYAKAKDHLTQLLPGYGSRDVKLLLAECYLKLGQHSTGIIICEELLEDGVDAALAKTYVELLLEDGQMAEAQEQYQSFAQRLRWRNEDLEMQLKMPAAYGEDDDELEYDDFLEKPDTNFSKVGGMDHVKEEIGMKIILPMKNPDLFKAYGKKAGGGILLYGPPGCGKTYLSRATAGEIDSKFMSIGIDDILDMWIGNSEKNVHEKFEIARANSPCVLFFDEVDALGSKRNDMKQSAGRNMINQFLKEMDGIDSDNEGLLILAATNSPWHMDSAFLRPGRFDRIIFVPPPDVDAREKILELQLQDKPTDKMDCRKVAEKTKDFSGADLMLLIDLAIEEKLRGSLKTGKVEPVATKDLLRHVSKVRPSTKDWFSTARNYALYSNSSGIYDDVLSYLKL